MTKVSTFAPSPVSGRIAFDCGRGGRSVCTIGVDGRNLRVIGAAQPSWQEVNELVWSPDRRYLAVELWRLDPGEPEPQATRFEKIHSSFAHMDGLSGRVTRTGQAQDPTWETARR